MFAMMKEEDFRKYISSGEELPDKHSDADPQLQNEVNFMIFQPALLETYHYICRPVLKLKSTTVVSSATNMCGTIKMLPAHALRLGAMEPDTTKKYVYLLLYRSS